MSPPSKLNPLTFFAAAGAPLRAFGFIRRQRGLWWLALLPFLINLALFSFLIWLGYTYLGAWLEGLLPAGSGWWWQALAYLLMVLLALALLALGVYLFAVVGAIVAAPFLEMLTVKTERLAPGMPPGAPPMDSGIMRDIWRVIKQSLMRLALFGLIMLPLLLLNLIPGLGGLIYSGLAWLVTSFFLALEFIDYPLDRRGLSLGQKMAYVRSMGWGWLGFGSAVLVMGLVPVLNFALLSLAAVGGTLLYLQKPLPPKSGTPPPDPPLPG